MQKTNKTEREIIDRRDCSSDSSNTYTLSKAKRKNCSVFFVRLN